MSAYFILPTMFLSLFDIFHCLPGLHSVQFLQIFSFMNDLFCRWPLYCKFQWEYVQVWEFLSDSLVIFNSLWIIFWTDPLLNHVMQIFFAYDHFNTDSPCVVLMFVVSADSNMGLSVCMFCDFFFFNCMLFFLELHLQEFFEAWFENAFLRGSFPFMWTQGHFKFKFLGLQFFRLGKWYNERHVGWPVCK